MQLPNKNNYFKEVFPINSLKRFTLPFLLILLLITGCSSILTDYPRVESSAFQEYQSTTVGHLFEQVAVNHKGKSGFHLISEGKDALLARFTMIEMAEKSLDLQYYLWKSDRSGTLLAYHIIKAADRGVKVRILLDDIGLAGKDNVIATMASHPNIQIRIFNPFPHRGNRLLGFISDFNRLNRRMHNKVFVMDNTLAITGGRNIGDHYFDVAETGNWQDLDIAAAGPIVREISEVHDYFWNGEWSIPIAALAKSAQKQSDLKRLEQAMQKKIAENQLPYPLYENVKTLKTKLTSIRDSFIWAKGIYVWNDPKIMALKTSQQQGTMIEKLKERVKTVRKSLHVESAYFVPRNSGIAAIKRLHNRGVNIQLLTNSLLSNDVLAAHAGYANYRKKTVKAGVELYELRPDASTNRSKIKTNTNKLQSGLHSKTMAFDEEALFIGSFNLDPRSAALNTEGGLYVQSPALTKQLIAHMTLGISPKNSYKVVLDDNGGLDWITQDNGKEVRHKSEPKAGFMKRFTSGFIQILPVELLL